MIIVWQGVIDADSATASPAHECRPVLHKMFHSYVVVASHVVCARAFELWSRTSNACMYLKFSLSAWHTHMLLCCRLAGCIPVPAQTQNIYTPTTTGTKITGSCPTQRAEVEGRQRAALNMLPALFSTGQPDWQDKVNSVLQTYRSLPDYFNNASDPTAFRIADPIRSGSTYLEFSFEVVNGAVCVTGINAQSLRVNTKVLTQFLAQLPFLRSFKSDRTCSLEDFCAFPDMPPMPMPLDLAASAPAALTTFELTGNNLTGTLPSQWGQWNSIQELTIRANALVTGTLPESWAGMRSLTSLTLSGNTGLTGPLPALYGTAAWAASLQLMDLSEDEGLNGTIPSLWAGITAAVFDVTDTGLGGCVPDQLLNTLVWSTQPVAKPLYPGTFTGPCSQDSSEMTALLELMSVFGSRNPGLATWTPAPPGYTPEPLPGECIAAATHVHVSDVMPQCNVCH